MADVVLVPRFKKGDDWYAKSPAWSPVQQDGKPLKPLIRCNCGQWSGIALHHVHADGTVTASFFHATKAQLDGSSYETANVHDNTVACFLSGCAPGAWFASTSETEPSYPEPTAAGVLTVKNTTLPATWGTRPAVLSCGPGTNSCGDPKGIDAASVTFCNTGAVAGNGAVAQSCP